MIQFIFHDINFPYTLALFFVLFLAAAEGVFLLIGGSLLEMVGKVLPLNIDTDVDLSSEPSGFVKLLGWLNINKLPLLVWLVIMFSSFAVTGYIVTFNVHSILGLALPFWASSPFALIGMGIITHHLGNFVAKVAPKEQSAAVHTDSFAGLTAKITLGVASQSNPAEALLKDQFNQKHYVMVEPENTDEKFAQGAEVVLIKKAATSWLVKSINS